MDSTLDYSVKERVAIIRLQRPEVRNALNPATLSGLIDLVRKANTDPDVRALILTGGPEAFCTGEDLNEAPELSAAEFSQQIADFQTLASALRNGPKPVIAAMAGPAAGGGVEIALNCDTRIAASNALMLCPELKWGLTVTNGASVLLRRAVGETWAREIILFGRTIDAQTALQIGLVTRVVEPSELDDVAWEMARSTTDFSVEAMRLTKALLNADPVGWQDVLDAEAASVTAGFTDPDVQERLASFARRRSK